MRRSLPLFRVLVTLASGLVLTVLAVLALGRMDRVVRAPGALAGGSVPVRAPRDGRIARVLVTPGQAVRRGDALVELDRAELIAARGTEAATLGALAARREALEAEAHRLAGAIHPRELDEAARAKEKARLELAHAETRATAAERLGQEGLAGRLDVDRAALERSVARLDLEQADRALSLLSVQHRGRLEEIAAEVARIDNEARAARIAAEEVERAFAASTLVAPADGRVATAALDQLEGAAVSAGDEVLRLSGGPVTRFAGRLDDRGRAAVRPGQTVRVRLEAYPWLLHGSAIGRVVRVEGRRAEGGGFPVEIALDDAGRLGALEEGMAGTARIVVEKRVALWRLLFAEATGQDGP